MSRSVTVHGDKENITLCHRSGLEDHICCKRAWDKVMYHHQQSILAKFNVHFIHSPDSFLSSSSSSGSLVPRPSSWNVDGGLGTRLFKWLLKKCWF